MSASEDAVGFEAQNALTADIESSQMPAMIALLTKLSIVADTQSQVMHRSEAVLEKMLATMNGQNQQAYGALESLTGTVKDIQTSLHKLGPQEKLADDECDRESGKKWPKDRNYFRRRLNYYRRKWKDVDTELIHLETHYEKVSGDRGVIEASSAFRKALRESNRALMNTITADYEIDEIQKLEDGRRWGDAAELKQKHFKPAISLLEELTKSAVRFHESLYVQKHAFYFRKMRECCDILEKSPYNTYDPVPRIIDDLFHRMEAVMFELVRELNVFREKALPEFLTEEKERITNRYLNITTIATFFSSVTASALAISLQSDNEPSTYATVNLFWFTSLVFSVSSGASSLLGLLWHNSRIFYSNPPPPLVKFWFERSPMVSLIVAALSFVVGLNIYIFVSAQTFFVSRVTTVLTGLHIICLFFVVLWFLCQLYNEQSWAKLLIYIDNALRRRINVVTSINLAEMMNVYNQQLNLRRNINWALRLDNRVGLLNTYVVQNFDPEQLVYQPPHLTAKVIRAILAPIKLVKDCKYWIVFRMSKRQHLLSSGGSSSQIDLEAVGRMTLASEYQCMTGFRERLDRTFDSRITESMMSEIDALLLVIESSSGERLKQRDLKLEALFWGYPDLFKKFEVSCLPHLPDYRNTELTHVFNKWSNPESERSILGSHLTTFIVRDGEKTYALKMPFSSEEYSTQAIMREYVVHVRKKLHHRNVMPILGVYHEIFDNPPPDRRIIVAFEWMKNDDLGIYMQKNPPNDPTSLLLEIAHGLQYLHSLDVIHGSLSSRTVLIDDYGRPRISGFENAHISDLNLPLYRSASVRALRYIAPEALNFPAEIKKTIGVKVFTKESDIYAFAYLCFEVYSSKTPWWRIPVFEDQKAPHRPDARALTDDAWALIERCWAQKPEDRPIIDEVVQELTRIHTEELASGFRDPIATGSALHVETGTSGEGL